MRHIIYVRGVLLLWVGALLRQGYAGPLLRKRSSRAGCARVLVESVGKEGILHVFFMEDVLGFGALPFK